MHTPKHNDAVVYVPDASRAVGAGDLLSEERKKVYVQNIKDEYETCVSSAPTARPQEKLYPQMARYNAYKGDWKITRHQNQRF